MIVSLKAKGTNAYNRYAMYPTGQFVVKLNALTWLELLLLSMIFYLCSYSDIFFSIKDVVRRSVKVPEFDKHLKKAGGLKRCGNNNKDEDNSPKTLNDKNHQASSQKFRQLINPRCIILPNYSTTNII